MKIFTFILILGFAAILSQGNLTLAQKYKLIVIAHSTDFRIACVHDKWNRIKKFEMADNNYKM